MDKDGEEVREVEWTQEEEENEGRKGVEIGEGCNKNEEEEGIRREKRC